MGSLLRKVAGESLNYENYDTLGDLLTFIKKSFIKKFLSITLARFYILLTFFGK